MHWIDEKAAQFAWAATTPGAIVWVANDTAVNELVDDLLKLGVTVGEVDGFAASHMQVQNADGDVLWDSLTKIEQRARELVLKIDAELVEEDYVWASPDLLIMLLQERNKRITARVADDAVFEVSNGKPLGCMRGNRPQP